MNKPYHHGNLRAALLEAARARLSEGSEADLALLEDVAGRYGAGLVTTEKDWVRLPPEWRTKAAVWPVRARFEDEGAVLALLGTCTSALVPQG